MVETARAWLPVSAWNKGRAAWRQEIIDWHGAEQLEPMIAGWVQAAQAIAAADGDICPGLAPQIRCPTLLINGDGEQNLPEDVQRLAATIPNCRLEFVARSGHSIQNDQPEVLIRLIRQFLAGLSPS
nr:alpha/beta hydrolase [uncultured Chloroflexus sp.]